LLAKLNSSARSNFSAEISATPQTFNVARNLSRMSLVTALQNDEIDLTQQTFVFSDKNATKLVIGDQKCTSKGKCAVLYHYRSLCLKYF
jgi:hypothetical protein